jgi:AraC-like DNA-binding protein
MMRHNTDTNPGIPDRGWNGYPVYFHYRPAAPLDRFIDIIWYWRQTDLLRGIECVLPTGTAELVIDLGSPRDSDSMICGVKSKPAVISGPIHRQQAGCLLGVHFRPGGVFPFLPFPAQELHNADICISDLWGERQSARLLDMIHATGTIRGKIKALEQWLHAHLYHPLQHAPSITLTSPVLQSHPGTPIRTLADKVNLSQRHFILHYQREIGLAPKLFARIMRFQKALDEVHGVINPDWHEVAAACGYFDQSHFNHEFLEFSGVAPANYLKVRTPHRNHLPLPG